MKIRAHHLLCIQGFQGYGYNKEFMVNMSEIIEDLKSYPNQKIQIITDCDILCAYCPHNKNDICAQSFDSNERIRKMDIEVLETIELQVNTTIEAYKLFKLVNKNFKPANIHDVCGNCKWKDKCLFFNQNISLKI